MVEDYDLKIHMTQRLENLFNTNESADLGNFMKVLEDIKLLLKDYPELLQGFEGDLKKLKQIKTDNCKTLRESLKLILDTKDNDEFLSKYFAHGEAYMNSMTGPEMKYMQDVLESITSFIYSTNQEDTN